MTTPPPSDGLEQRLFEGARRFPPGAERDVWLAEAGEGDAALVQRVQELLQAFEERSGFLEQDAPTFISPSKEQSGEHIGPYKLREQIGEGGFGTVWVADQEDPVRRRVALKITKLGMDTKEVIARFEQERHALAMMDHPNIAKVLDAGTTDHGRPYFVMELVRGVKITDYCDQQQLSMQARIALFITVCQAVQHAHQKGIIHRDLKPSNILVSVNDGTAVPKVIDFGVAKATQGRLTEGTVYTQFQQMIGTPLYMSPEQAEMTSVDIDTRSDIYALGVLLYELLTGRTPIDTAMLAKAGMDEIRRIIREVDPPRPSARVKTLAGNELTTTAKRRNTVPARLPATLRGDLDWIVMKCIEKDRKRRYDTANGLALDLQRHLANEVVTARPPTAGYLLGKLVRRHRLAFAAGVAISASLVLGIATATWMYFREREARKQTADERDAKEQARKDAEDISKFLGEILQSPEPAREGREIKVAELLETAAKKLETDLSDQPAHRARLQAKLGKTYHALGLYPEAIRLLEKARDYHLFTSGREHADTIAAMGNVAMSYSEAGRREEALQIREEVVKLARKVLGPEHPDALTGINNLANSYDEAGRKQEALRMREELLALSRKVLGPEHSGTLRVMNNLAASYSDSGRDAEALKIQQDVLEIRRNALGPEHPDTLRVMSNLAVHYSSAGRHPEALKLGEEVLMLFRRVCGPEHSETLVAMANLSIDYITAGRRDEALKLREEVLTSRRKALGLEHPDTIIAMNILAASYSDAGRKGEALQLVGELVAAARKSFAKDPSSLEQLLQDAAELYHWQRQYSEAAALYRERIESGLRRAGGETSDTVLSSRASLGRLYSDWAWDDRSTAGAVAFERAREGEKLMREVIATREADTKHPSWRKADLESQLGGALLVVAFTDPALTTTTREPKLVEAEKFLQQGEAGMERDRNAEAKYRHDGIERLIRLYDAWQKPDKIAMWKRKLMALENAEVEK